MTRNVWVGVVVVIALVAGGWWYFNQSGASSTPEATQLQTEHATSAETQPASSSDSVKMGHDDEWVKSPTAVYFRGNKTNFDSATFVLLFPGFGFGKDCWTAEFVKDKNGIYVSQGLEASQGFAKIEGVDPATFEVLKSGAFSRDKNYLYEGPTRTDLDPTNPANYNSQCG